MKIKPIDLLTSQAPVLDVRSPKEYKLGHIPGARSFPLFSDSERAQVGTCYKREGQQAAIKLGLDIVGPKMRSYIEQAEEFGSPDLNLYCWRGGMRSESMAWLLSRYGFTVQVLDGGYKSYRRQIHHYFDQAIPMRVLSGYTGSAKTKVLHQMIRSGAQVVDLEGLANHQGSSFGNQLSTSQPTTEQFQNDLLWAFLQLDQDRPIWVEDESICIGKVSLPEPLFVRMTIAPHYILKMPKGRRIEHLLSDYGELETEKLKVATVAISKRLGHEETQQALHHLEEGDLSGAAAIILLYYDRQYRKSIEKKLDVIRAEVDGSGKTIEAIASELIEKECQLS